jgi:hypothetical protein
VGYFLPHILALLFNYIWESAEGIVFSEYLLRDAVLGRTAVEHGRMVRRSSTTSLGELIRRDLCDTEQRGQLSAA